MLDGNQLRVNWVFSFPTTQVPTFVKGVSMVRKINETKFWTLCTIRWLISTLFSAPCSNNSIWSVFGICCMVGSTTHTPNMASRHGLLYCWTWKPVLSKEILSNNCSFHFNNSLTRVIFLKTSILPNSLCHTLNLGDWIKICEFYPIFKG